MCILCKHFSHCMKLDHDFMEETDMLMESLQSALEHGEEKGRFLGNGSIQFSSVAQLCPILWDPIIHSMPGLPVHHQLPELTQARVHWVGDAIPPSPPLSSPSPPAPNLSQQLGLFQWVNSLHEVAKLLEFQFQHQSFQGTPRTDL